MKKYCNYGDFVNTFEYILFDLDGTLTKSDPGILNSVKYALAYFGIKEEDEAVLNSFIGPPLVDSFRKHYPFTEEQVQKAVEVYRERFSTIGLFENSVYDGVMEMLETLCEAGKKLFVATSKPEAFSVRIVEHFGLNKYFSKVYGATFDETRCHKNQVIAYLLETEKIADKSNTVMIGDRNHDILGAKANGLASIGVTYGYGTKGELIDSGADVILETPKSIADFILNR